MDSRQAAKYAENGLRSWWRRCRLTPQGAFFSALSRGYIEISIYCGIGTSMRIKALSLIECLSLGMLGDLARGPARRIRRVNLTAQESSLFKAVFGEVF